VSVPEPSGYIREGEHVMLGKEAFSVLFTPGHSPGSICFYHEGEGILLDGDVLFQQSIGRTDLPGGDYNTLIHSITTQLLTLPDAVTVYSGHGPATTIGFEKNNNPFLKG
jgi:glyoxylase-like metal-dependent hydrolase (beta-lactamase superfamily II)